MSIEIWMPWHCLTCGLTGMDTGGFKQHLTLTGHHVIFTKKRALKAINRVLTKATKP